MRKHMFTRPEPGFSMYEGRTRGKKMKYTFSSDDEDDEEGSGTRRSNRQSGAATPADSGPTVTASGRMVRPRRGGTYGETVTDGTAGGDDDFIVDDEGADEAETEARQNGGPKHDPQGRTRGGDHIPGYNNIDEIDEEEDAASSGDDYGAEDDHVSLDDNDDGDEADDSASEVEDGLIGTREPQSLVVSLRLAKNEQADLNGHAEALSKSPAIVSQSVGGTNARQISEPEEQSDDTEEKKSVKHFEPSAYEYVPTKMKSETKDNESRPYSNGSAAVHGESTNHSIETKFVPPQKMAPIFKTQPPPQEMDTSG
jgi:hypothetical protein